MSVFGGWGEIEGDTGLGGIGTEKVLLEWISVESVTDNRLKSKFESSDELLV